jgi:thymidylate synthase
MSQDVPLGTVFNVGMYSLLAHLLASQANMVPWEYTHLMGDHHIYSNQVEKVKEQLSRDPLPPARIIVDSTLENIEDFNHKNLCVFYRSHEKIVFPHAAV